MQKEESGVTYFRIHKFIEGFTPSLVVICYLSNNLAGEKWYFETASFPAGEGICLVLDTTSHDHGDIPTGFVRGTAIGAVKNTLPGTMVDVWKWEKSVEKNSIYLFVLFANEK